MLHEAGFTALFAGSLLTMAVISDVPVAPTGVTEALTLTTIARTVISVLLEIAGLALDVPVMVTCVSVCGGAAGALKVTVVEVGLLSVPAPLAGLRVQATPLLSGSPVTVLDTVTLPPAST